MRPKTLLLTLLCLVIASFSFSAESAETFVLEPVFGAKVRVVEAGRDNPHTLILVHGVGSEGAEIWNELIPELARDYHVVACDLPGFGKSDKPNAIYSPEKYSEFLAWLVKHTAAEPFTLVGHSLGGALALHYTATAAAKPDKLIVIDAAGILHRAALTKFLLHLKITEDKPYVPSSPLAWLDRMAGTMVEKIQSLPLDLDLMLHSAFLREKFLDGDPNKIAGMALVQTDFTALIDQFDTPTILIWGENDDIAPLRTGQLLAARLEQAQLVLIPDGGHVPMRRQPGAFRQAFWRALQTTPVKLAPLADIVSDRVGRCREQKDVLFSGYYRSIELIHCKNVKMVDVVTQRLSITDSEVTINHSRIDGSDVGLLAVRSRINSTGLEIEADLPIRTNQSSFDLAGVTLKGRGENLVVGEGNPSRLLFSVSRGLGPQRSEQLHGVVAITAQKPL